MQINSIAESSLHKTQEAVSNTSLHFKETLVSINSDKNSVDAKENALQKAFSNWRSEYVSGEGVFHSLMQPSHSKNINSDIFLETERVKGWAFPPPNAPIAVHNAWNESMQGLSQKERSQANGRFLGVNLEGNIKPDGSGFYEPGDEEYNNQFASAEYSYTNLLETMQTRTEEFRAQIPAEQYEKDKEFFGKLQETFFRYEVE